MQVDRNAIGGPLSMRGAACAILMMTPRHSCTGTNARIAAKFQFTRIIQALAVQSDALGSAPAGKGDAIADSIGEFRDSALRTSRSSQSVIPGPTDSTGVF